MFGIGDIKVDLTCFIPEDFLNNVQVGSPETSVNPKGGEEIVWVNHEYINDMMSKMPDT